jgi:hypothetical protein
MLGMFCHEGSYRGIKNKAIPDGDITSPFVAPRAFF